MATLTEKKNKTQIKLKDFASCPGRKQLTLWSGHGPPTPNLAEVKDQMLDWLLIEKKPTIVQMDVKPSTCTPFVINQLIDILGPPPWSYWTNRT